MKKEITNYVTPNVTVYEISSNYDILAGSQYDDDGMDEGGEI